MGYASFGFLRLLLAATFASLHMPSSRAGSISSAQDGITDNFILKDGSANIGNICNQVYFDLNPLYYLVN